MILSSIVGVISCIALALYLYYFSVTRGVKLNPDKLNDSVQNVRVYDVHGKEIDLPTLKKCAAFSSLPSHVPAAFVSIEDKRFYSHHGFDYKRIGKAVLKNIASFSFREGASTISQQLIKNTHLSVEKTVRRKLKEMKLTRVLEKNYSKDEILSLYLNSIYFGHSAFGIEEAASFYFQKTAETLSPAESATLAALVQSPNRYSPFRDREKCLKRRNFVLSLMKEQGYITEGEYQAAKSEPLPTAPREETGSGRSYLALVFEEFATLFPDEKPDQTTLRIYTAFDPALQNTIESYEAETDYAACVIDNASHAVKAYHSSVGRAKRLPASLIKPLAVYAPAIEENIICPATPILDERTDFNGYSPKNFGDTYQGYMSARYALSHSVNVPAVKIFNTLGADKGARYLAKMNLPVTDKDASLALALGGMSEGYDLIDLASAYTTFPCMGEFSPARAILKIESDAGRLYEWNPTLRKVFSEDTSALVTDMLQTAVQEGTAKKLRSLDFQIAAKTGTGANASGNIDAYTTSYTSEDTVAVWMGMRDNSPIQTMGGMLPATLALKINRALYSSHAPKNFPLSNEVLKVAFDKEEYERNHKILTADPTAPPITTLSELFRASALPQEPSTRFSCPTIQNPTISVKNGSVLIVLCQTEYYDYIVKRKNNGKTITIYEGKYRSMIIDNSVTAGEIYEYTVIPVYQKTEGKAVTLPSVQIPKQDRIPDDWWE